MSLEVSPLLAHDTKSTLAAAKDLHARAGKPNLFIKIPGTKEGLPAIEEAIFAGIPVNVTLLFSSAQYATAAGAYLRGVERRIGAGLNPNVGSVASLFVSRWDVAVESKIPKELRNQLGIAVAGQTLDSYRSVLQSARWQRILNECARAQRLLFASTGTKDPAVCDILDLQALAAPFTINTMPEPTLKSFADHGTIAELSATNPFELLARFADAGIDADAVASQLLIEGTASFSKSLQDLMASIATKSTLLKAA